MVFKASVNTGGGSGTIQQITSSGGTITVTNPTGPVTNLESAAGGGNVNTTGSPALGNITIFSGPTTITNGNLAGDATTSGSPTVTLATVNANIGTFGSANSAPIVTVNAKGLVTGVSTVSLGAGSVTTTGSPAVGNLTIFSGSSSITNTNLSGDMTTSGGSTVTLATVNANIGSYGSNSSVPIVTVNAKGLTTGVSTASYLGSALSGTSLASGILTSSLTQVGTLATATWQASTITVPYGGTGLSALTAHGVMLGEGASNVAFATVGTSGRILVDNGAAADPTFVALVGDATLTNNATLTLATVNSNVGTFGSTITVPVITVNAKGLTTSISTLTIAAGSGTVTTTGSPAVGNIAIFSGGTSITNTNLAGDVTTSGGSTVTLATVNSNIGSYGSSSSIPIVTVNAKGLTTGLSTASYLGSALGGTTLASGIINSSLTQVGTLATATWQASTITVPYGGTGLGTLTAHGVMLGEGASNVGFATIGTSGNVLVDQGSGNDPKFVAIVGDATLTNNATITLATVNSQVGTYGSTVSAPIITVNAKGLITGVSTVSIAAGSGTVTTTGSPAVGNIAIFSGAASITNSNLAGDVTTSGGSTVTLATVNSNIGVFGSSVSFPSITVNAKGLITGVSTFSASAGSGTVSNIATGTGLTGGPITTTGTISIATNTINTLAGFDNSGVFSDVTIGTNLTLSGGVLNATGGGGGISIGLGYALAAGNLVM